MAGLFAESFDSMVTADLAERFTSIDGAATINSTAGRRSSGGYLSQSATTPSIRTLSPADATAIIGIAFKVATVAAQLTFPFLLIVDGATTQVALYVDGAGQIVLKNGAGTTLGTSTTTLTAGVFTYIELKVTINNTTGIATLKMNGSQEFAVTGVDTQQSGTAQWTGFGLGPSNSTFLATFDDVYVLDGSGAANNDFLGDIRVDSHVPTGAGATTGFTPSAGANWQNVDDTTPDDDTTYNETGTVNAIDSFGCTDLIPTGSGIKFIEVMLRAKKTDAGTAELATLIRHGGVDYAGTPQALSTDYNYYSQVYDQNPDTAAAWTETSFEAAEFGYKKTT